MNDYTVIAEYSTQRVRHEIRFYSGDTPYYQYFKVSLKGDIVQQPISIQDWALDSTYQLTHPCFNWRHYLFEKAILKKQDGKLITESGFAELLDLLHVEFEHEHLMACSLGLDGLPFEWVLERLESFALTHPTLKIIAENLEYPMSPRPSFKLFITKAGLLKDQLTSVSDWDFLFHFLKSVNPSVANVLTSQWLELKDLSPRDILVAFHSDKEKVSYRHIYTPTMGWLEIPYQPPAVLANLPFEAHMFLTLLIQGYPLGVND